MNIKNLETVGFFSFPKHEEQLENGKDWNLDSGQH